MRPPSSPHSNFFSSLKQVEKRLKLDNPPGEASSTTLIESLSSPLYLNFEQANTSTTSSAFQDSEPPRQFLSSSSEFPQTNENAHEQSTLQEQTTDGFQVEGVNEIDLLVQLLGLSNCDKRQKEDQNGVDMGFKNGGDDSEFFAKVVGMRGPKSRKEVKRMDGWIKHFKSENDGEEGSREPLRLAHLLLGKFAFVSRGNDSFGGLVFPSTIEEFLQNDPPEDESSLGERD